MSDGTSIEWTDATVNAVSGCSVLSAGCKNCFAMRAGARNLPGHPSTGLTMATPAGHVWTGEVRIDRDKALQPLRWQRSRRIFWNAHGDLFHEAVPDEWRDLCFAVMAMTPHHQHQVLTKRADAMQRFLASGDVVRRVMTVVGQLTRETAPSLERPNKFHRHFAKFARLHAWTHAGGIASDLFLRQEPNRSHPSWIAWPLPNVWAGVSIENNKAMHDRAYALKCTPAAVRFWSAEPLLGPIGDVPKDWWPDWIIVGGESGAGARPMHPGWVKSLRDRAGAAGVPFFFKQWGDWAPVSDIGEDLVDALYAPAPARDPDGHRRCKVSTCVLQASGRQLTGADQYRLNAYAAGAQSMLMFQVGKHRAGRHLDGIEHSAMPA